MKKIILSLAMATTLLIGCNKDELQTQKPDNGGGMKK